MITKYIERLDSEIAALLEKESVSATTAGERDLHYLFENRKHAMEWKENKKHSGEMSPAMDNPGKSYFGGV